MRTSLPLLILVACSGAPDHVSPDAGAPDTPSSHACISGHTATADPDCPAAPNSVVAFASFHATRGVAHGVPAASFPMPVDHASTERTLVPLDTCTELASALPPCVCSEFQYCHPDGSCHAEPYYTNHDIGPVALAADGVAAGDLQFNGGAYEPTGELATRLDPLWNHAGVKLAATNAQFAVDVLAPAVPNVTSFAHTVDVQIEPAYQPLELTWDAGDAGTVLEVAVGTQFNYVRCLARDDGAFSIPWSVFDAIYNAGAGELFVFVDRTRRSVVESSLGRVELIARASDSQQFAFSIGR